MSLYQFKPRLFIVPLNGIEYHLLTIDGGDADNTDYFFRKGVNPSEEVRIEIAYALYYNQYFERMSDEITLYNIDITSQGYELFPELYGDVVAGYKKFLSEL